MNLRSRFLCKTGCFVVLFSLCLSAVLTVAVWDINFWPTDAEDYYLPAAVKLPQLKYVSQMHESFDQERIKWLHGKEMFIVSTSWLQGLMRDTTTLRPMILVCILSICFSSILIFYITRFYWGTKVGLICYAVFSTSFWPYLYILFVKHQPLGLFYFLLALFLVQRAQMNRVGVLLYLCSGVSLCLSVYSSTTSSLYIPYWLVGFLYSLRLNFLNREEGIESVKRLFLSELPFLLGFAGTFIYFNYPHIAYNIKSYLDYVEISKNFNHFFYNQPVLIQWIAHPDGGVRGGWLWVIKYFQLIMPVLFPFYVLCAGYLLTRCFWRTEKKGRVVLVLCGMIVLSFSTPLLAEFKGVAQYGANYFTVLMGMLMLLGYSLNIFEKGNWFQKMNPASRQVITVGLAVIFLTHAAVNFYIFLTDVYPTRMATTFLSQKIASLGTKEISTYIHHPYRLNMVDSLSPKLIQQIRFKSIRHLLQPLNGYILIPPVSGNCIYKAVHSTYNDFDKDIYLNELLRKGKLKDYAVASFKTMAASRIWPHEEEILTYRYLILNQTAQTDPAQGKVWLLDAKKIQQDISKNLPSPEYLELLAKSIRNIGTRKSVYRYEGRLLSIDKNIGLNSLPSKIYKIGNPTDSLVAYAYKVDKEQSVWIPLNEFFKSIPLEASQLVSDSAGALVQFDFPEPFTLEPGSYRFVIYRTGQPDDQNYYRIYERL